MIHDPLCPDILNGHLPPEKCPLCELIAEVGERERANMQADIDQASYALGRKWGYRDALRDAVEAVKALPSWNYTYGGNPPLVEGHPQFGAWMVKAKAVAAIEALDGER